MTVEQHVTDTNAHVADVPAKVVSGLGTSAQNSDNAMPLDHRTYDRALACIHCGLCLPACPTYTENGLEADSPRGRIYLMKGLADGRIIATESVMHHLDLCLDCRACETACPSGVVYHELIEETRAHLAQHEAPQQAVRRHTFGDRVLDAMMRRVFPHPTRLKLALLPARLMQRVGLWGPMTRLAARLVPDKLAKMQTMLPATGPLWPRRLATVYPAQAPDGVQRGRVGFFAGCIGGVLFSDVNRQAIRLLQHAGCEVVVPRGQRCCGAIDHHSGYPARAADMARANIDAFSAGGELVVDAVVNDIAGCGAMLRDYQHLLRDDPAYAARAAAFTAKVRDICAWLVELNPPRPTRRIERTVTYHDACHLAHAQGVTAAPRRVLAWIGGLNVVPLTESDMCCGAAGTYNLQQPGMARALAERKIRHVRQTGASVCVTGNVGCAMQIQSEAQRLGADLVVAHPVTLLHEAYFG